MILFLTSSFITYQRKSEYKPCPMIADNGFVDRLSEYWKDGLNFLIIASDPDQDDENRKHVERELSDAFRLSELPIGQIITYDHECKEELDYLLSWADCIFLAGGHAPSQNRFFEECNLRFKIKDFDGIVIGLSAGSANSAEEVYLFPEFEGEAIDPDFKRRAKGLGLTNIQIMPHSKFFVDNTVDGLEVMKDILLPDSYGRKIYFITDGSYFIKRNGITEFFGEGEIIQDGIRQPLYQGIIDAENLNYSNLALGKVIRNNYDLVYLINVRTNLVTYECIGDSFLDYGLNPGELYNHKLLCKYITDKLVVDEEKEPYYEQTEFDCIKAEIEERNEFVRTVHFQIGDERKSIVLRISYVNKDKTALLATMQDMGAVIDHDWMTDELARSGFIREAEKLIKNKDIQNNYSLLYTNIKGFKAINDIFGRQSGDMVIFCIKDGIRNYFKPILVGRLENEHFAFICPNEMINEDNLSQFIGQEYSKGYKQYRYDVRLGICPITDENITADDLIDRAKLAETTIGDSGHHLYKWYDDKLRLEYVNQKILLSDMRDGLKFKQFQVYYQPVVDLKTGKICSAEALVRWNHPEFGLVSPGRFIPIFENEGEISRLDYYIFGQICDLEKEFITNIKKPVPIAINLSRMDFYDQKLMNEICDQVKSLKLTSAPINVEVTESAYAILETDAINYLQKMKGNGTKILLDDYGSGMSSLSTLESFEFDILKLDMGFIRKIGSSSTAEAIISSTITLAHAIGAKVTAEGVETEEQLDFLKAANCDMIQGYYYYKPMPSEEFKKIILDDGIV